MTEVIAPSPELETHLLFDDTTLPTPGAKQRRRRRVPHLVKASLIWLGLIIFLAVFANVLPVGDPNADTGAGIFVPPFHTWAAPLGTDGFGRSELARLIYGARVSLATSVIAAAFAIITGMIVGVCAGFFRGKVDTVIGVIVDSVLSFPALILLLLLAGVLGPSMQTTIIALSVIGWTSFARLTRANTLSIATSDYVAAAKGLGAKSSTILFREIIPNVSAPVIALTPLVIGGLILAEAGLSFLGLSVQPPTPSWGNMIAQAQAQLQQYPYLLFIPGVVLFVTIFSVNFVGEWLRSRRDSASRL
jgi:peptide/nickel transport system permease protein